MILVGGHPTARQAPGGTIFHVLNLGNARDRIFDVVADHAAFEFYAPGQSHDLTTGSRE